MICCKGQIRKGSKMSKALSNKEIAFLLAIGGTVGGLGTMCGGKLLKECKTMIAEITGMLQYGGASAKTLREIRKGFSFNDYNNPEIAYAEATRLLQKEDKQLAKTVENWLIDINERPMTGKDNAFVLKYTKNAAISDLCKRAMKMCNSFEG